MLIPTERAIIATNNKIITTEEFLKGDFIESFNILKNPLRLEGIVSVSEDEFKDIIYTAMKKYNIQEFKYTDTSLHDNYIKVRVPYKLFKSINTQFELNIFPTVVDNNLYLTLKDFKIGKIKIGNSIVNKVIESNAEDLPFEIKDNVIIVNNSYTDPLKIEGIDIKEDEIVASVLVTASDIINLIIEYNTK